jgi:toxin FitB
VSYLLDTNVVSETRTRRHPGVMRWIADTAPERRFLSVLTIGEIEAGITRLRGRADGRQADALARWLDDVLDAYAGRILPVTVRVARAWGRQDHRQPMPTIDAVIAATAMVHELTLVTRNTSDVAHAGVPVLNPFT